MQAENNYFQVNILHIKYANKCGILVNCKCLSGIIIVILYSDLLKIISKKRKNALIFVAFFGCGRKINNFLSNYVTP